MLDTLVTCLGMVARGTSNDLVNLIDHHDALIFDLTLDELIQVHMLEECFQICLVHLLSQVLDFDLCHYLGLRLVTRRIVQASVLIKLTIFKLLAPLSIKRVMTVTGTKHVSKNYLLDLVFEDLGAL